MIWGRITSLRGVCITLLSGPGTNKRVSRRSWRRGSLSGDPSNSAYACWFSACCVFDSFDIESLYVAPRDPIGSCTMPVRSDLSAG